MRKPSKPQRKSDQHRVWLENEIYLSFSDLAKLFPEEAQQAPIEDIILDIDYDYGDETPSMSMCVYIEEPEEEYQVRLDKYQKDMERYNTWYKKNEKQIKEKEKERKEREAEKKRKEKMKELANTRKYMAKQQKRIERLEKELGVNNA
jgi:ATPase subunit of ABC transporter with duplicated ATPase domains